MPEVIISYGHDSPEHKEAVHRLARILVQNGITTRLDEWVTERHDWPAWMQRNITSADYTLVIASPDYRAAGDGNGTPDRSRGLQQEAALLRELLYRDRGTWTRRILPVLLPGRSVDELPDFLQPYTASHYRVDALTSDGVEALLRVITQQPRLAPPPLGDVPVLPPDELPEDKPPTGEFYPKLPRWSGAQRSWLQAGGTFHSSPPTSRCTSHPLEEQRCPPIGCALCATRSATSSPGSRQRYGKGTESLSPMVTLAGLPFSEMANAQGGFQCLGATSATCSCPMTVSQQSTNC
ncbi:toll/interleukin-1 receptor domain-containing protein [Actinosynnema mirum]|uniref:SEFIR domain protein n=1 Tax=Actinosynnema mirum (strain ATCC 29888 / DSM 43827 / JCM 3225 / NBRC 14064 / NCIMB 13271 / NRRL B-12336 / IMRU 3971 / 101) TaxID=446462 RepID=C6WFS5_ACTMD|nr:SEFIR domain protein [Actinosynnema mirum DSM 43827]